MSKRTLKEAKISDTKSRETGRLVFFENEQDNEECLLIYDTLSSLFSSKSSILFKMQIFIVFPLYLLLFLNENGQTRCK